MELNKEHLAELKAIVDGLSLDDAVDLYNAVCYECNYPADMIYSIAEIDDLLRNLTPSEIIRTVTYGDFSYSYEYFTYDSSGNLQSIRRAHDLAIDLNDVVHVYEKDPSQLPDPVKDFLNELEEESESESESK